MAQATQATQSTQVFSSNMVGNVIPPALKWTPEAAEAARKAAKFIRVTSKPGASLTTRYFTGSDRSWGSDDPEENRTVFHTGYRISGTPENIQLALRYAGVPDDQIDQILASAITKDNYQTTMAAQAEEERALRDSVKENKQPAEGTYSWGQLLWFAQNLKRAIVQTKSGGQKGPSASPGRGSAETLADKVKKLQPGKVVDVSNMDINTGKGARTIPIPKRKNSGKYGASGLGIISNNFDKYVRAIQLVYGPGAESQYAGEIRAVGDALAATAAANAMPVAYQQQPGFAPFPNQQRPGAFPVAQQQQGQFPVAQQQMGYNQQQQMGYNPQQQQSVPGGTIAQAPTFYPAQQPQQQQPAAPGANIAPNPVFAPVNTQQQYSPQGNNGVPQVASPQRVGTVGGESLPNIPPLGGLLQQQ